jgi:alkanesulfonate monooxygenase SsuD/methylene tetrahydromethanopterin reductase-like flavin-dependent oxidoreductase (luciferase family)
MIRPRNFYSFAINIGKAWENDALKKDKQQRVFTDPNKVHSINHQGQYYQSQGVFQVAPSVQRTPTLFQAGASPKGLQFATRHAECIFIGGDQPEKIRQQVNKIRLQAHSKVEMKMRLKSLSALPLLWLKHMNLPSKNWLNIANMPALKQV